MKPDVYALTQTTVALCECVNMDRLYRLIADKVDGFPGVWQHVADAAIAFDEAENGVEWDGGFFEAIEAYAKRLTRHWVEHEEPVSEPNLKKIAAQVVEQYRMKEMPCAHSSPDLFWDLVDMQSARIR